jgi:predicted Zn-dependent peptidase
LATETPVYIAKEEAVQTSIRIGKRIPRDIILPATHDTQYLPVVLFNEILGGYFGSRLMKNIREEKGLTYGIHSSISLHRYECLFAIGTDVKKELRDMACEEILKELNALINTPVSEEELSLVKNYLTGSFIGSLTTSFAIAEKYRKIYFHEFPEDYFDTYVSRINQITAEAIQEAGAAFFKESEQLILMVG